MLLTYILRCDILIIGGPSPTHHSGGMNMSKHRAFVIAFLSTVFLSGLTTIVDHKIIKFVLTCLSTGVELITLSILVSMESAATRAKIAAQK